VEEDVRTVTEVLIALVGIVVGGMSGYVFGVLRTLNESRNERRDAALAEIFKEMALFYRYLVSWTDNYDPDPNNPTGESSGIPAKDHVGNSTGSSSLPSTATDMARQGYLRLDPGVFYREQGPPRRT
jgi:hypothetical protein